MEKNPSFASDNGGNELESFAELAEIIKGPKVHLIEFEFSSGETTYTGSEETTENLVC
jgi:hypothetical protein